MVCWTVEHLDALMAVLMVAWLASMKVDKKVLTKVDMLVQNLVALKDDWTVDWKVV